MKTVDALSKIEVVKDGAVVEEVEIINPCRMWKKVDELFIKHGDTASIKVYRADGVTLFKDFIMKALKSGKKNKYNLVKETNRPTTPKKKPAAKVEAPAAEKEVAE